MMKVEAIFGFTNSVKDQGEILWMICKYNLNSQIQLVIIFKSVFTCKNENSKCSM